MTRTGPGIDILLPFYGDPQLLYAAVSSVLAQTSSDYRLVVVDDCYPDPEVAAWFERLDSPYVEYHRNPSNLGVNGNFSRVLSLARAEHVVFMGCDDLLEPGYVAAVSAALRQHPGAAVVSPGTVVIDSDGNPTEPLVDRIKRVLRPKAAGVVAISGEEALVSLMRGNWTYFPSLCWRRELVDSIGFRPEYGVVLDLGLLVDVLLAGGELLLLPGTQFRYRRHANSESSLQTVTRSRFAEERHLFERCADELDQRGLRRAARAARLHLTSRLHAAVLVPAAVRKGDFEAARALTAHSCR
jgi:glycosyltransferase involved in cell wall biosynthesis